ncbi:hypothetical protein KHA80_06645 [Anaerobacillus sp. HL2]|nr:hypothetical protein KHA80_06645 [Anaerobacillus sp. HL2]
MMKTILHLEDIVEIETLQKIQDDFSGSYWICCNNGRFSREADYKA